VIQGLYRDFGIAGFLMEQRISYNAKLGRLPEVSDRLKFGAELVKSLAEAVLKDKKLLEPVGSYEDAVARLLSLPGWGPWTAQYWALRALRDSDAFPESDVGLLRSPAVANGNGRISPKALLARAENWRPWRAYAAQHLWTADGDARRLHA